MLKQHLLPGQVAGAHSHQDMWEVFLVQAGEGVMRINERDYPLVKGNCLVVEPGEVHEVINIGSGDLILTYFGVMEK